MKTFLRILCVLLLGVVTSQSAPAPTQAEKEKIEQQRDELVDQLANKLTAANHELAATKEELNGDKKTQADLQTKTDTMAKQRDDALAQVVALKASLVRWKRIVAVLAGLAALLVCLWLDVPKLATPYGLIGTIAAPLVVFGIVMLL